MRVVLMAALVGAGLTAPAAACPQGTRCIAMVSGRPELATSRRTRAATPAPTPPPNKLSLTIRVSDWADGRGPLHRSLSSFRPAVVHAADLEMPELWAIVASSVKDQLPRYENDEQFSMVLSPVVVTMPSESTPGLGLSGDF